MMGPEPRRKGDLSGERERDYATASLVTRLSLSCSLES